jgi:hypothetical protein
VKCPECVKQGLRSKVFAGETSSTFLHCPSFYDEEGELHTHDSNVYTCGYRCSNGHEWSEDIRMSCWCGWPKRGESEA